MSYVVLARKWRPQQFSDVLGQEHVTRTLENAIASNRVAHAFLFSGPRGVGKTSAARILAKALCCEAQDGPTATPCGGCQQCLEITDGRSTDVFEIDAASHTGVDNVREIIDNVRYLPSSARFKIYVIDEVHMLSTGAFNALLKTLEEPPPHVKFILATTDVHKVPVTILSRCQRYDFRRIALGRIAERLSFILSEEGLEHDPSALSLVAREAEGSMRDAQSLLEQVLAFAGTRRLDGALVRDALGVVDAALITRTVDGIFERRAGDVIKAVSDVHERGLDLKRFADALVEHVRDLLVAKLVREPNTVLDRPSDEVQGLVDRVKDLSAAELERVFEHLCGAVEEVGRASHPRFVLEVQLATLAEAPARVPVEELLGQLERVEALLAGGAPPSGRPGPSGGSGGGGSGRPSGTFERSRGGGSPGARGGFRTEPPARRDAGGGSNDRGPNDRGSNDRGSNDRGPNDRGSNDHGGFDRGANLRGGSDRGSDDRGENPRGGFDRAENLRGGNDRGENLRGGRGDDDRREAARVGASRHGGHPNAPGADEDDGPPDLPRGGVTPHPNAPEAVASGPAAPTDPPADAFDDEPRYVPTPHHGPSPDELAATVPERFRAFVDVVKKKRPPLAATLVQVRPLAFEKGHVELGCETRFDLQKLEDADTKKVLEGFLAEYFGAKTPLSVRHAKGEAPAPAPERPATHPATLDEVAEAGRRALRSQKEQTAIAHPAVKAIEGELGGKIANVRVLDEGS